MSLGKLSFMPYMSIYIDADFSLHADLLAFEPLPANHNADIVQQVLQVRHALLSVSLF